MNEAKLIDVWRGMLAGVGGAWVLFENGTCVTLSEPGTDLAAQATAVLRELGHAGLRSAAADWIGTVEVPDGSGWVVASRHADINTFVGRGEVPADAPNDAVGRLGRSKRSQDLEHVKVVHIED